MVDDAQWLDAASADVLAWVVRRLPDGLPVRLLVGRRLAGVPTATPSPLGLDRAFDAERVERLVPGPLPSEAVYAMVRSRLGVDPVVDDLAWVHEDSRRLPSFYGLELARGLERRRPGRAEAPLPDSLAGLVDRSASHDSHRDAPRPRRVRVSGTTDGAALRRVLAPDDPWEVLAPALDDGIVEAADDLIRFGHPMLAAGGARRALGVGDPAAASPP